MTACPRSLSTLPREVWINACFPLSVFDLAELHQVGDTCQLACDLYFTEEPLTFRIGEPGLKKSHRRSPHGGTMSGADRHKFDSVKHLCRRAIFYTDNFNIDMSTISFFVDRLIAWGRVISDVTVIVDKPDGLDFFMCEVNDQIYNWSDLSQLVMLSGGPHVTIKFRMHIHVFFADIQLLNRLFDCPLSDQRCVNMSILTMTGVYSSQAQMMSTRPDLGPSPIAAILSKFPCLDKLILQRHNVDEHVLKQLALTSRNLRKLILTEGYRTRSSSVVDIPIEAWQSLRNACGTQFQVVFTFRSDNGIEDIFTKTLKVNAPVSKLTVLECSLQTLPDVMAWLCLFLDTLQSVTIEVNRKEPVLTIKHVLLRTLFRLSITGFVKRLDIKIKRHAHVVYMLL